MDLVSTYLLSFCFFLGFFKLTSGYCLVHTNYNPTNIFCRDEDLSEKLVIYDDGYWRNNYHLNITINGSNTNELGKDIFEHYPSIKILKISNTHISVILPGAFSKLSLTTELYITHNDHLQVIKSLIFSDMPNLERLDLSFNNISFIEEHAFYKLEALKYLTLSNNKITYVDSSLFTWSTNIININFSYNKISTIEASTLSILPLETLYLQNNFLKNISSICSHISQNIQYLDLSNNQIEDYKTCMQLRNLTTLKLSSNNLTDIDFLNNRLNNLQVLDLSDNNFEEINHTFPYIPNLKILILSHNKLHKLQLGLFQELTTVINLNLSNNAIQVLSVGCFANLHNLQSLNLSYNNISELQLGVFQDLSNLVYIDLSFNNLTSLYESCFYVLKNLKTLKVDNNHIAVIDVDILTRGKPLNQISLENNDWKCNVLAEIIVKFEHHDVSIENTLVRGKKNIHGITCDDETATVKPTEIFHSGKTTNNTSIKPQLVLPNLEKFDENFKKTAFFDMAKKISNGNLLDVKKFDDNFKNTEFYNFIKGDLMNNNFSAIMKHFDGAFANTLVYKSLQKEFLMKKFEELALKNVNESALDVDDKNREEMRFQKYLEDGFRNSTFYKYFEQFSENNNRVDAQKLVQDEKNMDYSKHIYTLLIFVVLLLTISVSISLYEKYQNYGRIKFNTNRNGDTASGILMT